MAQPPQYQITEEFVSEAIDCFRNNRLLEKDTILNLIRAAQNTFQSQPLLVKIDPGEGERVTVCGDIHGQLFELLEIFRLNGNPCEKNIYLFNGDFVDRGPCSIEVAFILYAYKLLYPKKFFVNRGNHETVHPQVGEEFRRECLEKYDQGLFDAFLHSFQHLPLATVIANKYFVVHGGPSVDPGFALDNILVLPRSDEENDLRIQLLWNDPVMPKEESNEKPKTPRGGGQLFNQTVVNAFLERERLSTIIRSHEFTMSMEEGYKVDGNCITIFSAANYKGGENGGAYFNITSTTYKIRTFTSPPLPDWYNAYKYL
ncbi:Metallo-dependent phosphatase-like protein [Bisporella sp. PMI_857]|nr:Metallo-dependent phosphatase-like protein [Bisporella sp. PMI_857]